MSIHEWTQDILKKYLADCEYSMRRSEKLCAEFHSHEMEGGQDKCQFYEDFAKFENRHHELELLIKKLG